MIYWGNFGVRQKVPTEKGDNPHEALMYAGTQQSLWCGFHS